MVKRDECVESSDYGDSRDTRDCHQLALPSLIISDTSVASCTVSVVDTHDYHYIHVIVANLHFD